MLNGCGKGRTNVSVRLVLSLIEGLTSCLIFFWVRTESQPAFYNAYEYQRGQKLGVLKLNDAISERLAKDSLTQTIHPRHLPMLVKPKPWLNYDDGGYIYNKSEHSISSTFDF
jgi:DNA-directed RNA polymerase